MTTWQPGDIYEDCAFHPVLCYLVIRRRREGSPWWRLLLADDWDLCGISLLDGSRPRTCSVKHCAPQRITLDQALSMRGTWEQGHRRPEDHASAEAELDAMLTSMRTIDALPDATGKRVVAWLMSRFRVSCGCD